MGIRVRRGRAGDPHSGQGGRPDFDQPGGLDGEAGRLLAGDGQPGDGTGLVLGDELLDDQDDPVLGLVVGDADGADHPGRLGRLLERELIGEVATGRGWSRTIRAR